MADSRLSSLARSSALMTSGTLVSRILGLLKAGMLATAIGVTVASADAFDIANKAPNTLYMLLSGGVLNAVLVPQIVRAAKRPDGGKDFTDRLLTLAMLLLGGLTLIATLAAPLVVWVYSSSEWTQEQTALATAFAYWCMPQIFFLGLYTMFGQVLNAKESYGPYMWAPVLNNIVAIAGLAVFLVIFGPGDQGQHAIGTWDGWKIALLAGSATVGIIVQALILLWPLARIGYVWRPRFGFRGVGLGTAGRVASWTFGAVVLSQLAFVVTSRVASSASSVDETEIASNAAYTYAYLIFMLPHSLVAVSLATVLFTRLSSAAAEGNLDSVRSTMGLGLRLVGFVNVLATAVLIVLAVPAAMVVAEGTLAQARSLGAVIITMTLGLVVFSANFILHRVFYAFEDAKTPFWTQVPRAAVTVAGVVVSGLFLPTQWIVAGIGLAMTLGYLVSTVLSAVRLRRHLGLLGMRQVVVAHLKFLLAGAIAAAAGWAALQFAGEDWYSSRMTAFATCAVIATGMLIIYTVFCYVFRVGELRDMVSTVRRRLSR